MKKTLIALAVLAASGASFAQATITGALVTGWAGGTAGTNAGTTDSSGLGVDTSQINFSATEDLGGGWRASANMSIAGADRSGEGSSALGASAGGQGGLPTNGGVSGRDASLAIATPNGTVTLATAQSADYLSGGIAGVGAFYQGFNGRVHSQRSNRDTITYSLPVGAWSLSASAQEPANRTQIQNGSAGTTQQRLSAFSVTYNASGIIANAAYLAYSGQTDSSDLSTKDVYRLSGSYNFGVANVGLGVQVGNQTSGATTTDSAFGVSVPVGKVTLGGVWVARHTNGMNAAGTATTFAVGAAAGLVANTTMNQANGTNTGWALQASYALSRRTAIISNYSRWDSFSGVANSSSQYLVAVAHSF